MIAHEECVCVCVCVCLRFWQMLTFRVFPGEELDSLCNPLVSTSVPVPSMCATLSGASPARGPAPQKEGNQCMRPLSDGCTHAFSALPALRVCVCVCVTTAAGLHPHVQNRQRGTVAWLQTLPRGHHERWRAWCGHQVRRRTLVRASVFACSFAPGPRCSRISEGQERGVSVSVSSLFTLSFISQR